MGRRIPAPCAGARAAMGCNRGQRSTAGRSPVRYSTQRTFRALQRALTPCGSGRPNPRCSIIAASSAFGPLQNRKRSESPLSTWCVWEWRRALRGPFARRADIPLGRCSGRRARESSGESSSGESSSGESSVISITSFPFVCPCSPRLRRAGALGASNPARGESGSAASLNRQRTPQKKRLRQDSTKVNSARASLHLREDCQCASGPQTRDTVCRRKRLRRCPGQRNRPSAAWARAAMVQLAPRCSPLLARPAAASAAPGIPGRGPAGGLCRASAT